MKRQIAMMIMKALGKGNRMLLNQYKRMMGYDDTSKMVQEAQQMLKEAKPKQMLKPDAALSQKALDYNKRLEALGSPLRIEKSSKVPGKTNEMYGLSGMPDEALKARGPASTSLGSWEKQQLDSPDMIKDMMSRMPRTPGERMKAFDSPRMGPDGGQLTPFGQALETGRKGIDWLWDLVKKNPLNDKIL